MFLLAQDAGQRLAEGWPQVGGWPKKGAPREVPPGRPQGSDSPKAGRRPGAGRKKAPPARYPGAPPGAPPGRPRGAPPTVSEYAFRRFIMFEQGGMLCKLQGGHESARTFNKWEEPSLPPLVSPYIYSSHGERP